MTDPSPEPEQRLALFEARMRTLEIGAGRAAAGLEDHESRLVWLETRLRVKLHVERLEERER